MKTVKKKNTRFMYGVVGVSLAVGYLTWTGISESMMYYMTPAELLARVEADGSFGNVGVKVGGMLVPGSYSRTDTRRHAFLVSDPDDPSVTFPVEFGGSLPDTFRPNDDDVEVVVEGRFGENGVFLATTVLTKCGSRYEASEEALAG